jgi:methylenetetrahydrofolate--tRNA-(uracil-5-)-methyltransferase
MLGALLRYVHEADASRFQPMNANFGLLPPLDAPPRDKRRRKQLMADRSLAAMETFARELAA